MSVSSDQRHESAKNLHVRKRNKVVLVRERLKKRVVVGPPLELSQRGIMRGIQLGFGFAHTEQDRLAAGKQRRPDFFESGLLFPELPPIPSAQDQYHDDDHARSYQTRQPIDFSRPSWAG